MVGALAASIAFWAWTAQRTVLDPDATRDLASALVETGAVTDSLTDQIAEQLASRLPTDANGSPVGIDPEQLQAVAAAVANDERVHDAFGRTIASLHEQLLAGDRAEPLAVDSGAIERALRDALTQVDPALAAGIDPADPFRVQVDAERLPSLRPVSEAIDVALLGAALLAVIGFGLGVAVHPDPWTAVAVVGRRLVAIAVLPVVLYVVVPAVLRGASSDRAETLLPFADAYGSRILPAAIALLVGGVALWVGGIVGRRSAGASTSGPRSGSVVGSSRRPGTVRHPDTTVVAPTVGPGRTDLRL
jgi:hypothetical protein